MLLCQLDGIPEPLKLFDQAPLLLVLIVVDEVVFSFLLVGLGSGQHVVVDHQNAVPHRNRCSLAAASLAHAPVLRPQVRLRLARRMSGLHQDGFGVPIAFVIGVTTGRNWKSHPLVIWVDEVAVSATAT